MKRGFIILPVAVAASIVAGVVQGADPLPQSPDDGLLQRSPNAPAGKPFGVPPKPKPKPVVHAPVVAAPPVPPPLPYVYGGSGRLGNAAVVFLEKQGRSTIARVGDVVDGAYKVEAIERDRAVLRYIPYDVAQIMPFAPAGASPSAPTAPLFVKLPEEIPLGRESTLEIGIPRGSAAAKATVEVAYDAEVLRVSGAKIIRPGRAVVEMSAQEQSRSKELRLKPIGQVGTQTELVIEVNAFDAKGKSVEVRVPEHTVSLVEGN